MVGFTIAVVVLIGACMQWLSWKLRVPAILFLLFAGLILGPGTGLLDPDALIGDLFFPFVSLAVAVILFEGALTLHIDQLKDIGKVVYRLCTTGAFITAAVIAYAAYALLGLGWQVSLLLGAVLVVTGPTVISSMLRNLRPTQEIDRILRWEGIVIDPLGALYAVLLYEGILFGSQHDVFSSVIWSLGEMMALGLGVGLILGWFIATVFRRQWVPLDLQKFLLLAVVLFAFSLSHLIQEDSGLLTVTVMGIFLANQRDLDLEPILTFKEDLSLILISLLFIFLAARVDVKNLMEFGPQLLLFLLVIQFIARPLSVVFSTRGQDLSWQAKAILCWVAPRGIVAAAVASAFAFGFAKANIPDANQLVPLVFAVIIFTVILQSLTAPFLARMLGVQQEHPRTILIIGASQIAREIGKSLLEQDVPVYLTDSIWENYRLARMNGLPSFYGRAQSEYAERVIPMNQITHVLALSPDKDQNAIAIQHFAHRFNTQSVFSIRASEETAKDDKHESAIFRSRQILFGEDVTYAGLMEIMRQEGRITKTAIGSNFSWNDYQEHHKDSVPLFIFDEKKALYIVSSDMKRIPKEGDTILAFAKAKRAVQEESQGV